MPSERGYWIHPLFRIGVALIVSIPATVTVSALVRWSIWRNEIGLKEALDVSGLILAVSFIPFLVAGALHPRIARSLHTPQSSIQRSSVLAGVVVGLAAGGLSAVLMLGGVVGYFASGAFFGVIQGAVVGYWKRGAYLSY